MPASDKTRFISKLPESIVFYLNIDYPRSSGSVVRIITSGRRQRRQQQETLQIVAAINFAELSQAALAYKRSRVPSGHSSLASATANGINNALQTLGLTALAQAATASSVSIVLISTSSSHTTKTVVPLWFWVVLAFAIVISLAIIIFCFMKWHKRRMRRRAVKPINIKSNDPQAWLQNRILSARQNIEQDKIALEEDVENEITDDPLDIAHTRPTAGRARRQSLSELMDSKDLKAPPESMLNLVRVTLEADRNENNDGKKTNRTETLRASFKRSIASDTSLASASGRLLNQSRDSRRSSLRKSNSWVARSDALKKFREVAKNSRRLSPRPKQVVSDNVGMPLEIKSPPKLIHPKRSSKMQIRPHVSSNPFDEEKSET